MRWPRAPASGWKPRSRSSMRSTSFGAGGGSRMTKDFADFLTALNSEGVAYVVIGGMAVLSYIPYRTTRDLDVLIEPTPENAARARRAVERLRELRKRHSERR